VVQESDPEDASGAGHPVGDLVILGRWARIPRRVIVCQDHTERAELDRGTEDLTWVDDGEGIRSPGQRAEPDGTQPSVDVQRVQLFAG